ncbi:unnamed protein product [Boreogadus saida]
MEEGPGDGGWRWVEFWGGAVGGHGNASSAFCSAPMEEQLLISGRTDGRGPVGLEEGRGVQEQNPHLIRSPTAIEDFLTVMTKRTRYFHNATPAVVLPDRTGPQGEGGSGEIRKHTITGYNGRKER